MALLKILVLTQFLVFASFADAPSKLETYIVDGGGEDVVLEQLEAQGVSLENGLFTGKNHLRCWEVQNHAGFGACLISVPHKKETLSLAILVAEKNGTKDVTVTILKRTK